MALIDSIYIKTLKVKPAVSQIFNKKNFNYCDRSFCMHDFEYVDSIGFTRNAILVV